MLLIPSIDVKDGKCVRLRQGRMDEVTVFDDDPRDAARRWVDAGARRLHLVDLDGAVDGAPRNAEVIRALVSEFPDVDVQVGGGVRDDDTIEGYLATGARYVILGTRAVTTPGFVADACVEFPGHVIVGLDARDGRVAVDGWSKLTRFRVDDLARRIEDCGVYFAEAPLRHDDLDGHAKLAAVSSVRVGGAEFAAGRWEVREWLERGGVSLVQPGVSRAGGFTELMRIAEMCEMHGAQLVPHSFATGITDAANFHLQASSLSVPMVEFRSSRLGPSRLRTELVSPPEPPIVDGYAELPTGPGLGLELNEDLVAAHTRRGSSPV